MVVDEDGRGVGGAVVEVMVVAEFGADQREDVVSVRLRTVGTARSDPDGRFVVVLDPAFAVDDPLLVETPAADPPSTNFRAYAIAPGRSGLWLWPGALVLGPTGPRWIEAANVDAGPSAPAASVTITMAIPSTAVPVPTSPPAPETLTTKKPLAGADG